MIPQMQSKVGELEGRCFEACIASLLEIPEHQVPDFPHDDETFIEAVQMFLREWGLFYMQMEAASPDVDAAFKFGDVWHVVEGMSERGGQHACVGLNGRIIHDPHPGGHGLVRVDCYGFLASRCLTGPKL